MRVRLPALATLLATGALLAGCDVVKENTSCPDVPALRQEMILAKHPVKVTTVHPGGIKTAIARNATTAEGVDQASLAEWFDTKMARTSPERAAQIILDGVAKNRARVLVGADAKILDIFIRVSGSGYQRVLTGLAGKFMPPTH